MGRFITPDAWTHGPDDARLVGQSETCPTPQLWLTQPRLAHPYVYSLNNPLTHHDPLGLSVGLTVLRTILAIFWSLPWTVFGFALGLVDALLQLQITGQGWISLLCGIAITLGFGLALGYLLGPRLTNLLAAKIRFPPAAVRYMNIGLIAGIMGGMLVGGLLVR